MIILGVAAIGVAVAYILWLLLSSCGFIVHQARGGTSSELFTSVMIWNFGWRTHVPGVMLIPILILGHISLGRLLGWRRFVYLHA